VHGDHTHAHSPTELLLAHGDLSWTDGLHLLVAPLKLAVLSSPYMKVRLTAWETTGETPTQRVLSLENRAGWGAGAWGPLRLLVTTWGFKMYADDNTGSLLNKVVGGGENKEVS